MNYIIYCGTDLICNTTWYVPIAISNYIVICAYFKNYKSYLELCDGLGIQFDIGGPEIIGGSLPKQEFLELMSEEFCGCRIVEGSISISRPGDEVYSSTDFEFLSSVEEIGDTLAIRNLNLTDNITLPNLRLIRGCNLLEFIVEPMGNPALYIHNVTGPVYLPQLTEITLGDVYIQTVSFCNHRGVLWEDILTEPGSHYEDIGNDHCPCEFN